MYWHEHLDGLELQNQAAFHHDIQPVSEVESDSLVHNGQRHLPAKGDAGV